MISLSFYIIYFAIIYTHQNQMDKNTSNNTSHFAYGRSHFVLGSKTWLSFLHTLICKTKEITHTTKEPVEGTSDKVKWAGERAPMLRVPAALRIHDWLPAPTCGSSQLSVTSSYWGAHNSGPCRQCVQGHAYTCTRTKFKSRSFYKGSPYPCLGMSHYREKKGDQAGKCTQTLNAVRFEI